MNRPFLKAGLIGGGVLIVLNLLGLIPVIGLCTFFLAIIAYAGVGALAAYYLPPRREAGRSAGQGALAGLIAGLVSGIMQVVLTPLSVNMAGGTQAMLDALPAESLQQLEQAGIDPAVMFSAGTYAGFTLLCCLPAALLIGAGLGALGGAIYAAMRPE
jgi:hypothetical protein